jgi:hypothetical protein
LGELKNEAYKPINNRQSEIGIKSCYSLKVLYGNDLIDFTTSFFITYGIGLNPFVSIHPNKYKYKYKYKYNYKYNDEYYERLQFRYAKSFKVV